MPASLATVVHALGDLQRLETVRFLCSHTPQSGGLVDGGDEHLREEPQLRRPLGQEPVRDLRAAG